MKSAQPRAKKRLRLCQMPSPGNIAGRSSSITNAFFNAIIPIVPPTEEEELEALDILGMDPTDIRCAYCGDKSTEWDHLRAIITDQRPTGFITEIANLVPACGKCNQSKGKAPWRIWMMSSARLSPKTRGITDIDERMARLSQYEQWREPKKIAIEDIVDAELWKRHQTNWRTVLDLLKESQKLAKEIREAIERSQLTH
jgi:5-methylcytosine-specific restriction endonuclease McrA